MPNFVSLSLEKSQRTETSFPLFEVKQYLSPVVSCGAENLQLLKMSKKRYFNVYWFTLAEKMKKVEIRNTNKLCWRGERKRLVSR